MKNLIKKSAIITLISCSLIYGAEKDTLERKLTEERKIIKEGLCPYLITDLSNIISDYSVPTVEQILEANKQLWDAVNSGHLYKAEDAIKNGADVEVRSIGWTPLIQAGSTNDSGLIIKLLLDNGADINAVSNTGNSALMEAARNHNLQGAIMLIVAGANKNIKNDQGKTVYDLARENSPKIAELLNLKRVR